MAFQTVYGIPVFRSGTSTSGLDAYGIPVFGLGSASADVTVALTGNNATGSVGTLAVVVALALSGVAGTGGVGTVTPSIGVAVALTGVQATGSVGTVVPSITGLTVALSGVEATGSVGSVGVSTSATVALTGVSATGSVGSVVAEGGNSADVIIVKCAPFTAVDTITTAGFQLYHYVANVLTADHTHNTADVDAVPSVTNGYCVGLTAQMMTLDSDGGYRGVIVWDSGGGVPFYRDDEVYIPPVVVSTDDSGWSEIIEGSYTAKDAMRILLAIAAGKTDIVKLGKNHGMVTFRDVTDNSDIVQAEMQSSERIVVTITP